MKESIKKYAEVYVSSETLEDLKKDIKSFFKESVEKFEKRLKKVEKTKGVATSKTEDEKENESEVDRF